jgi:translation initiation factor IF-1
MGKKNLHGGAGYKKFARKHNTSSSSNTFVRTSKDDNELYAIATKMLGNNMFQCHCIDNIVRICCIRGKFSGRNKRDNTIVPGTWILIGLREWENTTSLNNGIKKLQQCDLLEIYSGISKERLKELEHQNWSILNSNDLSKVDTLSKNDDSNDFEFITDRDEEIMRLNEEIKSNKTTIIKIVEETEDEDIDIDDI